MFLNTLNMLLSTTSVQQLVLIPLLVLLPLEVLFGAIAAAKRGTYEHKYLGDFAQSHLAPYVGMIIAALTTAVATHQGIDGAMAILAVPVTPWAWAQLNSIADNLGDLLGTGGGSLPTLIRVLLTTLFSKRLPPMAAASDAPVAEPATDGVSQPLAA